MARFRTHFIKNLFCFAPSFFLLVLTLSSKVKKGEMKAGEHYSLSNSLCSSRTKWPVGFQIGCIIACFCYFYSFLPTTYRSRLWEFRKPCDIYLYRLMPASCFAMKACHVKYKSSSSQMGINGFQAPQPGIFFRVCTMIWQRWSLPSRHCSRKTHHL